MYPRPLLTVVSGPATTDLTTLDAARSELQLNDTSSDPWLRNAISQASGMIVDFLNRPVALRTVTETFRIAPQTAIGHTSRTPIRELSLSCAPVTALTSVVEDGSTLTANVDYEFDAEPALLYRLYNDFRTSWAARRVDVSYSGGWLLPNDAGRTLPAVIERACLMTLTALYAARGRDPFLRSESVDQIGSASYLDPAPGVGGLPPRAADMLEPFRRIVVA